MKLTLLSLSFVLLTGAASPVLAQVAGSSPAWTKVPVPDLMADTYLRFHVVCSELPTDIVANVEKAARRGATAEVQARLRQIGQTIDRCHADLRELAEGKPELLLFDPYRATLHRLLAHVKGPGFTAVRRLDGPGAAALAEKLRGPLAASQSINRALQFRTAPKLTLLRWKRRYVELEEHREKALALAPAAIRACDAVIPKIRKVMDSFAARDINAAISATEQISEAKAHCRKAYYAFDKHNGQLSVLKLGWPEKPEHAAFVDLSALVDYLNDVNADESLRWAVAAEFRASLGLSVLISVAAYLDRIKKAGIQMSS